MSTLTEFLTDVANAIRKKTELKEPIYPKDYAQLILRINGQGLLPESSGIQFNAVTFQGVSTGYSSLPSYSSNDEYAIFTTGDGYSSTVSEPIDKTAYAYNKSYTRLSAPDLPSNNADATGVRSNNYAFIAGGLVNTNYTHTNRVIVYDRNITISQPVGLSQARRDIAGTSNNDYTIFYGGYNYDPSNAGYSAVETMYAVCEHYNTSLTMGAIKTYTKTHGAAGTSIGDYIIFGGGADDETIDTTVCIDTNLVTQSINYLSEGKMFLGGASIGDYAIFNGGKRNNGFSSTVKPTYADIYNNQLVHSTISNRSSGSRGSVLVCGNTKYHAIFDTYAFNSSLTSSSISISVNYDGGVTLGDAVLVGFKGALAGYISDILVEY